MESALYWLFLNLATIAILAFFSMEEMACVSFNKIRLQFYVAQGSQRAIWLNSLLQNPSRLFGTTLIGVNAATFIGSECSRQFHEAVGLNPDLAPLSQVFLVIVFGELAPMFAARRYAEHVALAGIPVVYFTSLVMAPLIYILGLISKTANYLFGGQEKHPNLFLTQDELQKVLEEHDEELQQDSEEYRAITSNIFRLRHKTARTGMVPLTQKKPVSSQTTISKLKELADPHDTFFVVYQDHPSNIIGIAFVKDLIHAPDYKKIRDYCNPPWFISINTPLLQILRQFKKKSENIAVVLDQKGEACGILAFEDILEEIFEKAQLKKGRQNELVIDRTVEASTTLGKLQANLGIKLPGKPDETLEEFMMRTMEHHPEEGEMLFFDPYELTVKEATLLGIHLVNIKTKQP